MSKPWSDPTSAPAVDLGELMKQFIQSPEPTMEVKRTWKDVPIELPFVENPDEPYWWHLYAVPDEVEVPGFEGISIDAVIKARISPDGNPPLSLDAHCFHPDIPEGTTAYWVASWSHEPSDDEKWEVIRRRPTPPSGAFVSDQVVLDLPEI